MESITADPQTPIKPTRRGSVFAFGLAVAVGLVVWVCLSRLNDYQPLYDFKMQSKKDAISFNLLGPWIRVIDFQTQDSKTGDIQYRHLATGQLAFEMHEHPMPNMEKYLPASATNPNDGLITRTIRNPDCSISLIQPQLQQSKKIHSYQFLKTAVFDVGPAEYFYSYATLDMAPFLMLHGTGLPDVLATQFHYYLGEDNPNTIGRVALVRVYSSRIGKLSSTCSMPVSLGTFSVPSLLNDGEHFLIPANPYLPRLGSYFLRYYTTEEQKQALGKTMPGLMLFNHRTGRIDQEWKDIKQVSLDRFDQIHILIYTTSVEPIEHWNQVRPANKHRHLLLNTVTQKMTELPTSPSANNVEMCRTATGYQLFQFENLPAPSSEARCTWMLLDESCKVLDTRTWINSANPVTTQIPNTEQMILRWTTNGWLSKKWGEWSTRFPLLKKIPFGPTPQVCIYDFATQQQLLPAQGDTLWDYRPSEDGKYLLVVHKIAGTPVNYDVKVYDLPLVPHTWWANWLPVVAGCLTAGGIWWLLRRISNRWRAPWSTSR